MSSSSTPAEHTARVIAGIYNERIRQAAPDTERDGGEGFTRAHDDEHTRGELAAASRCYIEHAYQQVSRGSAGAGGSIPDGWPWSPRWWKPAPDPARNLEKGAALAAAEIERLQRAAAKAAADAG